MYDFNTIKGLAKEEEEALSRWRDTDKKRDTCCFERTQKDKVTRKLKLLRCTGSIGSPPTGTKESSKREKERKREAMKK